MAKVRVTDNEEKCEVVITINLIDEDEPLQIVKPNNEEAKIIKLKHVKRRTTTKSKNLD